jgi:hypothetical protein
LKGAAVVADGKLIIFDALKRRFEIVELKLKEPGYYLVCMNSKRLLLMQEDLAGRINTNAILVPYSLEGGDDFPWNMGTVLNAFVDETSFLTCSYFTASMFNEGDEEVSKEMLTVQTRKGNDWHFLPSYAVLGSRYMLWRTMEGSKSNRIEVDTLIDFGKQAGTDNDEERSQKCVVQ